jgi:3-carboxy-cis,cis-muconate cycloisomerase
MFAAGPVAAAVGDRAWLRALLDFEAGLALASARVGLVPSQAAEEILAACELTDAFDIGEIGRDSADSATPVPPFLKQLRAQLSEDAAGYVHCGATSQDAVDTAAMLVGKRARALLLEDLRACAEAAAQLAERHRDTLLPGRTLLQQALPTTFGLKAAGWMVALDDARRGLAGWPPSLQLGGAVGTLAAFGDDGIRLSAELAQELELAEPPLPWHTNRVRPVALALMLGMNAGVVAKIARDVILVAQTEVSEASESSAPGRGGSSTLPHKQNPVGAVGALACAERVPGLVATMLVAMAQEHERAAGAWQAEWETISDLLRLTGSAAFHLRGVLEGLEVDADRMRENLDATGGLLLAESVATALGPGKSDLVADAGRRAAAEGRSFRDVLLDTPEIVELLGAEGVDAALDPVGYLGSSSQLIDRALAAHKEIE